MLNHSKLFQPVCMLYVKNVKIKGKYINGLCVGDKGRRVHFGPWLQGVAVCPSREGKLVVTFTAFMA